MTISALVGAKSFDGSKEIINELAEHIYFLFADTFSDVSKKKYVILFLEGKFESCTRSKKMIMKALQDSIKKKLQWTIAEFLSLIPVHMIQEYFGLCDYSKP